MSTHVATKGLARAEELYQKRDQRAWELKRAGKKIIGYFCCYPPIELLTAADIMPYRITGSSGEPISQADSYLETIMCPFVRSAFDLALKGKYDFLDGIVVPHSCDTVERIYNIWRYYKNPPYRHYINVPHMDHPSSLEFFTAELSSFKKSLETYTGEQISNAKLQEAIALHNHNRALVRGLYDFRKDDPPLVSGSEIVKLVLASMSLPVAEANGMLEAATHEIKGRPPRGKKGAPRLMVYGSEIDDTAFIGLIEECGADVVMDDTCIGSRYYWADVETNKDPLQALSTRYLQKVVCPRTYRTYPGSHDADLSNRFGYLLDYVRDFKVNGVILYVLRFCDTHEFDLPNVRDYLEKQGLPVLALESDYSVATVGQLKTRVQAFLEIIG